MSVKRKSKFQPIAVVGRGCVLPGCQSVDDLWRVIEAGRVEVSSATGDDWRVDQARLSSDQAGVFVPDKMWSNQGGYVRGFADHFNPGLFNLDPDLIERLDPVFLWSLEAARQAMAEFKVPVDLANAGVVLGNLSYPTRKHSQFAEEVWLKQLLGEGSINTAAENRFMSGLPAKLVAKGLGLKGSTLALDAACASGLYAIKIACDRLQDASADLMLAGGINAADPLFIHMGFCALNALSKSGTSRPFHQSADGLVPSEGAAFVALKRLADARADGDHIYGVIRGLGLSNDGRSGGFLSPSSTGQVVCMQQAYKMADISPADVQFVECHATGTDAGDSAEIASLSEVFPGDQNLPLGSLKGNLGHLITASGVAGLLKIMLAFENKTIPGTPNAEPALPEIANNGFQVPGDNSEWISEGPRIAAISSFGFGGNNAHLIIQEDSQEIIADDVKHDPAAAPVAIVALAVRTDQDENTDQFGQRICGRQAAGSGYDKNKIFLSAAALAFPPNDLKEALGQQLVLLNLLPEIQHVIEDVKSDRAGIFIGMQTDSEVCRYGLRWRMPGLDPGGLVSDIDAEITPSLTAAGVIGKMPNVPANRISNQLNITGPGFTVSREELSGDGALELAMAAINRGELDAAIVGAVDFSDEQVHQAAISIVSPKSNSVSDAAILLVVKSLAQAQEDGDQILAMISLGLERGVEPGARSPAEMSNKNTESNPARGAHAAEGLLNIAAAVQRLRAGLMPGTGRGKCIKQEPIAVYNESIFGESCSWQLHRETSGARSYAATDKPQMEIYGADDRASLTTNIEKGITFESGNVRVALVGTSEDFPRLRQRAIQGISAKSDLKTWSLDGVSFSEGPMEGEVACVFTGAAAAYPGMGRDLFQGFPGISGDLADQMPKAAEAMAVAIDPADDRHRLPFYQLAGCSYLCQLHAKISTGLLGLKPDVAIGLSSGETNAMYAFGAWQDMDSLLTDIDATELYRSALAQDFSSVRQAWNLADDEPVDWVNYRVIAPVDDVVKAIADEDHVYLTIIQSGRDTVIGGRQSACDAVLATLLNPETITLGHDLAVHCSVVEPFEAIWRKLHTRKTTAPEGIRFYSNYLDGVYTLNDKSVADALTGQALQTIDFPKIIKAAWNDGVRIFIEHGPRNSLASAIDDILGDRLHLAVSLDHSAVPSMTQLYRTVATLWCAGVEVNLNAMVMTGPKSETSAAPTIPFSLRLPPIQSLVKQETTQKTNMHDLSQTDVYSPPNSTVGPRDGRLIPAAPALAFTINQTSIPLQLVATENNQSGLVVDRPARVKAAIAKIVQPERSPVAAMSKTVPMAPAASMTPETTGHSEYQLLVDGHQQMLDAHREFLAAQIKGQRAFTDTMNRVQDSLFGESPAVTAPPVVPQVVQPAVGASSAVQPISAEVALEKVASKILSGDLVEKHAILRPGPSFTRQQLEVLAGGKISSVLGELFEKQDGYAVQVRMPEPPLLLCDRVLGIEGEAGSMGTGTIWTETDVDPGKWYLHQGRMPPGIFIESGQADLLLISWLGIDFHNQGDRAYRLLGCELVFHSDLPQSGDTLEYEIKVDGHAQQGDVRLFFFHYDCHIDGEPRISVRNGQAGFFTKEELADSAGVLWDAESADYTQGVSTPEAPAVSSKSSFNRDEIAAYLNGDLQDCFGDEFAFAHTHTRTPGSPSGQGNFLGEVTDFDPQGGPAGRGYLRIVEDIHPDDWFFDGHFKNDPCMPGTLMADACLQAMAFYMSARGYSLNRDGWRFQPVRETYYKFVCRGQATPESKQLVYEVFIDEEIDAKQPLIFAHVLCTVDGRKAFLCERLGLELVPDWPLSSMPEFNVATADDRPLAYIEDFPLDYRSLISCAWGMPSHAFGKGFAHYDGPLRSPRLPGPPYHFMTRITSLSGEMASMKKGGQVEALYDIPTDAWYFLENGSQTMPYCIMLEIALQPCGWLASYTLGRDYANSDLLFRNLDGKAIQHREIVPGDQTLKTVAKLTSISQIGELIIENFDVVCSINDEVVYTVNTVFGFFPPDAMRAQKGLAINERERVIFDQPSNILVDLQTRPELYFNHPSLHLPDSRLLMVDRITHLGSTDGESSAGSIRGEKDVDITEWFFKAHFFQDPVQPGSLGIEAMLQLMQAFMINQDMHRGFKKPRFEPVLINQEAEWHYRGQVTPEKSLITIDFECAERGSDANSCWVLGDARLWADGLKIYHAPKIGMRILEDTDGWANLPAQVNKEPEKLLGSPAKGADGAQGRWQLDLASSPWIADHCPTYTVPSLPMMAELDLMANAVLDNYPGLKLTGIPRADAKSWLAFNESAVEGRIEIGNLQEGGVDAQLFCDGHQDDEEKLVASARFCLDADYPEAKQPEIAPLENGRGINDFYESGSLFHGPAFQLLIQLDRGSNGASGVLDLAKNGVPAGILSPGLLDAALHSIPHDAMEHWSEDIPVDHAAYPLRVEQMVQYSAFPSEGLIQVEARFMDLRAGRFPRTRIWLLAEGKLIAEFCLTEVLMPKGPLGTLPPRQRKAFLTGQRFIENAGIATLTGNSTTATDSDIAASNWLPGTIEQVYGYDNVETSAATTSLLNRVVVAEHGARILRIHPSRVRTNNWGLCLNTPLNPFIIESNQGKETCSATGSDSSLDWRHIRDFWVDQSAGLHYLVHDLGTALIHQFVRHIVVENPKDFHDRVGQPAIYLANHQLYAESFLFLSAIAALTGIPAEAIAKKEHQEDWIGDVHRLAEAEMAGHNPMQILFLDREDPADLLQILDHYGKTVADRPRSLLVHVEGTRAKQAGQPTEKVSSVLVDLAINCGLPIFPVRFAGGLPLEDKNEKFNFPVNFGKQDHYIGAAIDPETLSSLPYKERTGRILDGINNLGPDGAMDVPLQGDAEFEKLVRAQPSALNDLQKVLLSAIQNMPEVGDRMQALLDKFSSGQIETEELSPAEVIAMKLLWTSH